MAMPLHPAAVAWQAWKRTHPGVFAGASDGQYLENRINMAFMAGWDACDRRVMEALGPPAPPRDKAVET